MDIANVRLKCLFFHPERRHLLAHELGHMIGVLRNCKYNLNVFKQHFNYINITTTNKGIGSIMSYNRLRKQNGKLYALENDTIISILGPKAVAQIYFNYDKIYSVEDALLIGGAYGGATDFDEVTTCTYEENFEQYFKEVITIYNETQLLSTEINFIKDVIFHTRKNELNFCDLEKYLIKHFL